MQVVVAPSGAGKSSLLQAGLLPRLDSDALPGSSRWPKLVLTPTAHPLAALATQIGSLTGAVRQSSPRSLWSTQCGPERRCASYQSAGGIHRAVARTAEDLFTGLDPPGQHPRSLGQPLTGHTGSVTAVALAPDGGDAGHGRV